MKKIQFTYDHVCTVLMERGGFKLGLVTDAQFLDYFSQVMQDFVSLTGMAIGFQAVQQLAGVAEYDKPGAIENVLSVYASHQVLHPTDHRGLGGIRTLSSKEETGEPSSFARDQQGWRTFRVAPAPDFNGSSVDTVGGDPMYGVISNTTAGAIDIDVHLGAPWYGVPAGWDEGDVAWEPDGLGLGVFSDLCYTADNLTVFGTLNPTNWSPDLDTLIGLLHPAFYHYIAYGILAKIFMTDGELKDDLRAKFCRSKYDEGVSLGRSILGRERLGR